MNAPETLQRNSVRDALEDVANSGRQLMVNQFALIGAEAREGLDHAVNRLIEALVAILLGFCGFIILTFAGIHMLEEQLQSRPAALAIVGTSYVAIAFVLARMSAGKQPITGKDA